MNDLTENDICVPGEWTCDRCGFVVIKNVMNARTGEVGRSMADGTEACPNDGNPLRRIRYDEALEEARNLALSRTVEVRDAKEECEELLGVIRRIGQITGCNHTEDPDDRERLVHCVRDLIGKGNQ